ncbi:hypothetical protein VPH35_119873 [Triticum aestivum]
MADLVPLNNNPYNGDEAEEAVAAEPEERSRLMVICAVCLYYVAFRAFSDLLRTGGFHRNGIMSNDLTLWAALLDLAGSLLYLAASLLALVSLVPALWLALVLGRRLVDDLLQSDRWLFHEPFYRLLWRLFQY